MVKPSKLRIRTPAKINWSLAIIGWDGQYHQLSTLMQCLELRDELVVDASPGAFSLALDGPFAKGVTGDASNLVCQAHKSLESHLGRALDCRLSLEKNIPSGAGLGGGSSNAAATLKALDLFFDLKLDQQTLHDLASSLGSDVPFFLNDSPTALGEGRGERLQSRSLSSGRPLHLIIPPFTCSTSAVYQAYRQGHRPEESAVADPSTQLQSDVLNSQLSNFSQNDLLEAALAVSPELNSYIGILKDCEDDYAFMTGSGSTLVVTPRNPDSKPQIQALPAHQLIKTQSAAKTFIID